MLLSACCPPCEKPDYGQFDLSNEALSNLRFRRFVGHTYTSANGDTLVLTYQDPIQSVSEETYDCEFTYRCGVCCASYQNEFFYFQLNDDNNQMVFEFLLETDLARNTPEDPTDSLFSTLTIAYNTDQIQAQVPHVETASLTEDVELNGKTFREIRTFTSAFLPTFDDPRFIRKCYFSLELGVVGFELADGTIWSQ